MSQSETRSLGRPPGTCLEPPGAWRRSLGSSSTEHTGTGAGEGLIDWFRARSANDKIATFALISFKQIAAASIEQQLALRNALAASPAMLQYFETVRAALVASLDASIDAMRETFSSCNVVLHALGLRDGHRESALLVSPGRG